LGPSLAIRFQSDLSPGSIVLPLLPTGAVSSEARRQLVTASAENLPSAHFLRPESADLPRLSALWDSIALTTEEHRVVDALRIIEPSIEQIAFLGERRYRRGVFLRLRDSGQRLPIGNVGDGLKRLLALSLNLVAARGGYLFVDEIDTGLHFTVMENMWRLVIETANALDVQVFATTHSSDCVNSLASVQKTPRISETDIALHRIERDLDHTIRYSVQEIAVAARRHVEMR
jgi:predicted ATPase